MVWEAKHLHIKGKAVAVYFKRHLIARIKQIDGAR
jgi:hypothetical protein